MTRNNYPVKLESIIVTLGSLKNSIAKRNNKVDAMCIRREPNAAASAFSR